MDYLLFIVIAAVTVLTVWVIVTTPRSTTPPGDGNLGTPPPNNLKKLERGILEYLERILRGAHVPSKVLPEFVSVDMGSILVEEYKITEDKTHLDVEGVYHVEGVLLSRSTKFELRHHLNDEDVSADMAKMWHSVKLTLRMSSGRLLVEKVSVNPENTSVYANGAIVEEFKSIHYPDEFMVVDLNTFLHIHGAIERNPFTGILV